jgi:hypothetical protein
MLHSVLGKSADGAPALLDLKLLQLFDMAVRGAK